MKFKDMAGDGVQATDLKRMGQASQNYTSTKMAKQY